VKAAVNIKIQNMKEVKENKKEEHKGGNKDEMGEENGKR
jgi:hypothetical protein